MADLTITQLPELGYGEVQDEDYLPVVDVSAGVTKKIASKSFWTPVTDTVTAQASIATAQAGLAQTARTGAEAARTGAEAARDAALIQAGVYVDEPTGRAAVANGVAFKVQGSGDVAAYEYRRVSSTSSTLIATYPSKAAYDALAVRASDLESASDFIAGADLRLRVIKRLRLFGANTSKFYRLRYFFRNDVGTRFNITVQQVDDAAGTNPVDVCSFSTTGVNYSGLVEFTLAQMSSSGITGTAVVDFTGAAASWFIGTASDATRIRADAVANSLANTSYFDSLIQSSTSVTSINTRVSNIESATDFSPSCNAIFRYVKKLRLYGANTAKFYSVKYFFRNDIGTRFNFTVTQSDDAAGTNPVDVCGFVSSGVNYSGLVEFTLSQMSSSGVTGTLVVDFTSAPASWNVSRGFNNETFASTAIRSDTIITSAAEASYIGNKVSALVAADATITSLATRTSNLESATDFGPSCNALFRNVKKLRLFGANPAKFYSVRYFFRNDAGTRFNFTVTQSDDAAGTNPVDVCSFSTTGVNYSGLTEFSLSQISSSGVTGTLVVDFTSAPASFSVMRGISGETFATLAIRADALVTSAAESAYLDNKVSAAVGNSSGLTSGLKLPFADAMTNDALRRMVRELWMYGCDPTHDYAITGFSIEQFSGLTLTRFLFSISDLTTGNIVCRYAYQVSSLPSLASFVASIQKQVKLTDESITTKSGVYAVATLDLSSVTAWQANAYTTMAQAGISRSRTLSDEQIADYLDRDFWHEVIQVGAGQTFTTLRAAVESLYISPTLLGCNRSHYNNRILIDLIDDGTYNATYLSIPEFVEVRGNGVDRTFIQKESNATDAMLEAHLDTKFRDCTIISDTGDGGAWAGEYCIHSDDFNRKTPGSKSQNRRLRQSFKRLKLIAGQNQNAWIFGCGVSSGETIRFEDVIAEHANVGASVAAFGFHNTGPTISYPSISVSQKPALVEMRSCRSSDSTPYGVYLQSLDPTTKSRLVLHGCDFNMVYQTIATGEVVTDKAADRYGWEIGGVHAGPILQTDPDGMLVLGTTAGVSVSGTAATAMFGTVDELGRGDLWIKAGTVKSLGARLGDCTTVNKTLTIGSQTWTANQDYTAQSNVTIIASINASITSNPVAEVNIQYEIYPDTGYTRRMLNNTGASIPKGCFVKKTGANTIALATGDDDIFGWVYREIRNGFSGYVVTTKKIASQYLTGATTNAKFGITNGLIDYAAATKVGYVIGSIVTLYK